MCIYEEFFSKERSLNLSLASQTQYLEWRLSHLGKKWSSYVHIEPIGR